jgi:hypothetical protein
MSTAWFQNHPGNTGPLIAIEETPYLTGYDYPLSLGGIKFKSYLKNKNLVFVDNTMLLNIFS